MNNSEHLFIAKQHSSDTRHDDIITCHLKHVEDYPRNLKNEEIPENVRRSSYSFNSNRCF